MCVGQACVHGASKHIKQRADSVTTSCSLSGGSSSWSAEPPTVDEGISLNNPPEEHSYHSCCNDKERTIHAKSALERNFRDANGWHCAILTLFVVSASATQPWQAWTQSLDST